MGSKQEPGVIKIPILRLGPILIASIQVDLTNQEALEFQTDLLRMVTATDANGVVIDITALDVVDTFLAQTFNDIATMVQLLGAEVVLCGLQPPTQRPRPAVSPQAVPTVITIFSLAAAGRQAAAAAGVAEPVNELDAAYEAIPASARPELEAAAHQQLNAAGTAGLAAERRPGRAAGGG